jgi:hypothetical protein
METIDNRPQDEDESHDDRHLVKELESLYHQVARLDQQDASAESTGDLHPGGENHEARPTGAISGLDTATETFKPSKSSDHDMTHREELMERLNKIRDAYEKMLTYWPYASGDSPMAAILKKPDAFP